MFYTSLYYLKDKRLSYRLNIIAFFGAGTECGSRQKILLPSSTLGISPKKRFSKSTDRKICAKIVKKAAKFIFYDQKKF